MDKIWIIARKDINEALHSRTTYFYIIPMSFITLPYIASFRRLIDVLQQQGMGQAELTMAIQTFLNMVAVALPLVLSMLFCSFFSSYSIIMDKAKRTLESLLATPLSLRQIWIGKSLAVALPGIVITYVVLISTLAALNILLVVPAVGTMALPATMPLLTGLILAPVIVVLIVMAISFLQLIMTNPRIANLAYMMVVLGIYGLTISQLSSWNSLLIYPAVAIFLVGLNFALSRVLKKDSVVLTSKGQ